MTGHPLPPTSTAQPDDEALDLGTLLLPIRQGWRQLLAATIGAGALGFGASFLMTPQFTSTTTFIPPQQQQGVAASALASLGSLAGLAGGAGVRNSADQYVSLMQSVTVADRLIERFDLMTVYETQLKAYARKDLAGNTAMVIGKKDGMISVSVTDPSAQRAAQIANQYVDELRRLTSTLAVSEAQQRRVFFEREMQASRTKLVAAQTALQSSGFTPGAIKTEPREAAEAYARLRAEATGAEVKLQTLRSSLADSAPEVRQQTALLQSLRTQLDLLEKSGKPDDSAPDYVSKYREFKYQETLFDLMSKQYELARVDESREGALIQVVDPALPAEMKSKPSRRLIAMAGALLGCLAAAVWLLARGDRRSPR
jgi:capsule polysaccharide export protein KpsE/RkpR